MKTASGNRLSVYRSDGIPVDEIEAVVVAMNILKQWIQAESSRLVLQKPVEPKPVAEDNDEAPGIVPAARLPMKPSQRVYPAEPDEIDAGF